jgi:hypothetical protein
MLVELVSQSGTAPGQRSQPGQFWRRRTGDGDGEGEQDLTGATAYSAVGSGRGDRWYILADGDTVRYRRADGTFSPLRDSNKRLVTILTASALRRGVETWEQVPLDG